MDQQHDAPAAPVAAQGDAQKDGVRGRAGRLRGAAVVAGLAAAALLAVPAAAGAATPAAPASPASPAAPAAPAGTAPVAPADGAAASPASLTPPDLPGLRGPVVTHPTEHAFDYPAGEVCAFPSHSEFPVDDLTLQTWTDASGKPVFAIESGPLVMRTTNLLTGRTVESDISGTGVITYPDPDSYILSGNDWAAGFHTTDRPVHNKWIIASTFMSVKITQKDGVISRTLLSLAGPYEDLCRTLA